MAEPLVPRSAVFETLSELKGLWTGNTWWITVYERLPRADGTRRHASGFGDLFLDAFRAACEALDSDDARVTP
jgi:hypothetical protein